MRSSGLLVQLPQLLTHPVDVSAVGPKRSVMLVTCTHRCTVSGGSTVNIHLTNHSPILVLATIKLSCDFPCFYNSNEGLVDSVVETLLKLVIWTLGTVWRTLEEPGSGSPKAPSLTTFPLSGFMKDRLPRGSHSPLPSRRTQ